MSFWASGISLADHDYRLSGTHECETCGRAIEVASDTGNQYFRLRWKGVLRWGVIPDEPYCPVCGNPMEIEELK